MSLESVNRLAELTGRDRATVARRLSSLVATPGPKNAQLYESRDALPLLVESPPTAGDRLSLEQERAMLARRQRELAELKIEKERGHLIPAETVEAFVTRVLGAFRSRLLALPHRLASSCENRDYTEVERRATDLVHEALNDLAELES